MQARRSEKKSSTAAGETALVARALRATRRANEDARQDALLAVLEMRATGKVVVNPGGLARGIARRREADARRTQRRTASLDAPGRPGPNDETEAPSLGETTASHDGDARDWETLGERRRWVREVARKEAERRRWDTRWWAEVTRLLSRCSACEGQGVLHAAPEADWRRCDVAAGRLLVPPLCPECRGMSDAAAVTEADDPKRKRARKAAKARLRKEQARCEAALVLDGGLADAWFDAEAQRARRLRAELVRALCPCWAGGATPTARDLALAALLAGDWPVPAAIKGKACDDWRRMTDAEIVARMAEHMRKAHADLGELVAPLGPKEPGAAKK